MNNINEFWKDIPGYEGLYQVSNLGNVKSLKFGKEKILSTIDSGGYLLINLWKNGEVKHYRVHRLVAQAFLPNTNNYPEVNHKDENKQNNCLDNLEWCDRKYNVNYGTRTEKCSKQVGQYDLSGNLVKIWKSGWEIQKQLGFYQGHISACCRGLRKQAYGYIWKYIN